MIIGPFIGAEALAAGLVSRHQLRTRYRSILPGVYIHQTAVPTLYDRTEGAFLWSGRSGVVAGYAAAALHGTKWVDNAVDIDLHYASTKSPSGVRVHRGLVVEGEVLTASGMLVTTAARTGFDLARFGDIADVDALLKATGITTADIKSVAAHHRGAPGLRRLTKALALVDAGSESPKETWLRLLLRRSGLPPVRTQIEVRDEFGVFVARLDMGWPEWKIAIEYDGDQHRTDRRQYVRDMRRSEELKRLGWAVVRVIKEDSEVQIIREVTAALDLRSQRVTLWRKSGSNSAQE